MGKRYYRNLLLAKVSADPIVNKLIEDLAREEWITFTSIIPKMKKSPIAKLEKKLLGDPNTPELVQELIFEHIVESSSEVFWDLVLDNPNISSNILESILTKYSTEHDRLLRHRTKAPMNPPLPLRSLPSLKERALLHPNLPIDILLRYKDDPSKRIRAAVASNPNISMDLLEHYSSDSDYFVRVSVAMHPSTPKALLEKLLEDVEVEVRASAASNPNIGKENFDSLSKDRDSIVRASLASNKSINSKFLESLSQDEYVIVRQATASNHKCNQDLLDNLSNDLNSMVREHVALNPTASVRTILSLCVDLVERVRISALSNKKLPNSFKQKIISLRDQHLALELLQSGNAEPFELELMNLFNEEENDSELKNYSKSVRNLRQTPFIIQRIRQQQSITSTNFDVNKKSYEELLKDSMSKLVTTKISVLVHPKVDDKILLRMISDEDNEVMKLILDHYKLTEVLLGHMMGFTTISILSKIANLTSDNSKLSNLASHRELEILQNILSNPITTSSTIEKISSYQFEKLNDLIVKHPNVSLDVVIKLSKGNISLLNLYLSERNKEFTLEEIDLVLNEIPNSRNEIAKTPDLNLEIYQSLYNKIKSIKTDQTLIYDFLQNPSTPGNIIADIYSKVDHPLLVSGNPNTPVEILAEIESLFKLNVSTRHNQINSEIRINLAKNPSSPKSVFINLLQDGNPEIISAISENPGFSFDKMESILLDSEGYSSDVLNQIKNLLIMDENVTEDILIYLSQDKDPKIRALSIRALHFSSIENLRRWASDNSQEVRELIFKNRRRLPSEIIEKLSKDHSDIIRINLASSSNLPQKIFEQLSKIPLERIQSNLGMNPSTPYLTLRYLIENSNPSIGKTILPRIHLMDDLLRFRISAPHELQVSIFEQMELYNHLKNTYKPEDFVSS